MYWVLYKAENNIPKNLLGIFTSKYQMDEGKARYCGRTGENESALSYVCIENLDSVEVVEFE